MVTEPDTTTTNKIEFNRSQIRGNPFLMYGTNLPSSYGGMAKELWLKCRKNQGTRDSIAIQK